MKAPSNLATARVAPSTQATPPPGIDHLQHEELTRQLGGGPPEEHVAGPLRVAVLVAHGMGQQVPFETVDGIAEALQREQVLRGTKPAEISVRQVQTGPGCRYARVEMTLARRNCPPRETHLYEAYWAPLTEGSIGTYETFHFLLGAAWNGIRVVLRGYFNRYMFDSWQTFRLRLRTLGGFVLAVGVLGSLFLMNAIVGAVAVGRILRNSPKAWPGGVTVAALGVDLALYFAVMAVLLALGILLPALLRRPAAGGGHRGAPAWLSRAGHVVALAMVFATLAAGVVVALHATAWGPFASPSAWLWSPDGWLWRFLYGSAPTPDGWHLGIPAVGLWLVLLWLSGRARWFLRQFVGDVAVYVSSYKVDRFAKVRDEIQAAVMKVTRFVYDLRDPETGAPYYDRVVVVGHSLGSVVAYDALNAMIREDLSRPAQGGAAGGGPDQALPHSNVSGRTSALITYGSPLDKIALLFRQQRTKESLVREGLAAAMQPLIQSYALRPAKWINVWTPRDWISGDLDFYDRSSERAADGRRVRNVVDRDATTPLAAHNEYPSGRLLPRLLYREVTR